MRQIGLTDKVPIIPTAVYSRKEVGELSGCSPATIRRAEQAGTLKKQPGPGDSRYLGIHILQWLGMPMELQSQSADKPTPKVEQHGECCLPELLSIVEEVLRHYNRAKSRPRKSE